MFYSLITINSIQRKTRFFFKIQTYLYCLYNHKMKVQIIKNVTNIQKIILPHFYTLALLRILVLWFTKKSLTYQNINVTGFVQHILVF